MDIQTIFTIFFDFRRFWHVKTLIVASTHFAIAQYMCRAKNIQLLTAGMMNICRHKSLRASEYLKMKSYQNHVFLTPSDEKR